MRKIVIVSILLLAIPAFGQTPGDINCNGIPYEVTDIVAAVNLLSGGCSLESIPTCTLRNGDMDNDGFGLTIGDVLLFENGIVIPPPYRDYPRQPALDTLRVESAQAYPGQTLSLDMGLVTSDTLLGLEFYLAREFQYIAIDNFINESSFDVLTQSCSGNLFAYFRPSDRSHVILPGSYHLGHLVISVNPDIDQSVTTAINFSSEPSRICYTGLANFGFFEPILVNSTIVVNPTGIIGNADALPDQITLEAYPTPFNAQTTLFLTGMTKAEISIFDLTGRRIASLNAENGKVVWDARGFSSGIYFARAYGNDVSNCERLILLK